MSLLIDGNNLAGKLGILNDKDFDRDLISLIKEYIKKKPTKVILVFDSIDSLGDKYTEGNLTIIYTPRDEIYKNADDKIIEIIKNPDLILSRGEELNMVTDDNEIRKVAEEYKFRVISSEYFAKKLNILLSDEKYEDKQELGKREIDELNKELLKEWS